MTVNGSDKNCVISKYYIKSEKNKKDFIHFQAERDFN